VRDKQTKTLITTGGKMKNVVPFLIFLTLIGCSSTATDLDLQGSGTYNKDNYIMVCKTWGTTKDCRPVLRHEVRRDLQALFPRAG